MWILGGFVGFAPSLFESSDFRASLFDAALRKRLTTFHMMLSIRRSCQLALRRSNDVCIYANSIRRAFSRTSACSRGALPVFLSPSTPELSSLLSTFNSKVLLPSHLTKEQEKLVYAQENKAKLEAEPVEITLGEVTLPLEHLDRNHLPNRFKTFKEIIEKSKSREDWENVVRVLEGFENAGIEVKPDWQEKVVRQLNINGNHHLVLKALQRAKVTGLRMSEWRVLAQVLRGVHDKAALSDWEKEETTKALRFAKQVVELLEDEEHCGGQPRGEMVSEKDFRGKPAVVALPTELAAVLAERHGGDVEEVKTLTGRLMAAMKQDDYTTTLDTLSQQSALTESEFSNVTKQLRHIFKLIYELIPLVIVWNALKTSRKVLGNDMPQAEEARQLEARTKEVLDQGVGAAERLQTRKGTKLENSMVAYVRDAVRRCV